MTTAPKKSCHSYRETESWEMSHIFWYVYVCDVKPHVVNLRQFPFINTKCDKHETPETGKPNEPS